MHPILGGDTDASEGREGLTLGVRVLATRNLNERVYGALIYYLLPMVGVGGEVGEGKGSITGSLWGG